MTGEDASTAAKAFVDAFNQLAREVQEMKASAVKQVEAFCQTASDYEKQTVSDQQSIGRRLRQISGRPGIRLLDIHGCQPNAPRKDIEDLLNDIDKVKELASQESGRTIAEKLPFDRAENLVTGAFERNLIKGPPALYSEILTWRLQPLKTSWPKVSECLKHLFPARFANVRDDSWKRVNEFLIECSLIGEQIDPGNRNAGSPKSGDPGRGDQNSNKANEASELIVDENRLQASFGSKQLDINANADFRALNCLHKAEGSVVLHHQLFIAIKPNEPVPAQPAITEAPPEIRDAIRHLRKALKDVNAPIEIKNVPRHGYKLVRKKTD